MATKHHQTGCLSTGVGELGARHGPFVPLEDRLAEPARARLYKNRLKSSAATATPPPLLDLQPTHDLPAHVAKVRRVLEVIGAGDIYQATLTIPIHFRYQGDPMALHAALRVRQPVNHGGVVAFEDAAVLSVTPELFLSISEGVAESRPMKGTSTRGPNSDADEAAKRSLAADTKQCAENLMIVDLIRNDFAKISDAGLVSTPSLFTVESYPTFHTRTSTVTLHCPTTLSKHFDGRRSSDPFAYAVTSTGWPTPCPS